MCTVDQTKWIITSIWGPVICCLLWIFLVALASETTAWSVATRCPLPLSPISLINCLFLSPPAGGQVLHGLIGTTLFQISLSHLPHCRANEAWTEAGPSRGHAMGQAGARRATAQVQRLPIFQEEGNQCFLWGGVRLVGGAGEREELSQRVVGRYSKGVSGQRERTQA